MKINNDTGITYSAIKSNRKQNTKQNASTELESKMMQYTDTLSISKTGQENFKHLTSVSSMDYVNRFEKEVTDVFAKEDTAQDLKSDTFEHHVNRMAAAYDKMKNSIEEKYATEEHEPEYYVTDSGKIEELTKEKELDMLDKAYKNHSNFMAASTEIWSELKDFTPTIVYQNENRQEKSALSASGDKGQSGISSEEKGVIKAMAYQAFLSAIQPDNQKLSQQYSGDWKELRLNLDISDDNRKMLNDIWDYYANKK